MFCRACGYELRGLGAGACPECGRGFDPADTASFLGDEELKRQRRRRAWIGWAATIGASWPLVLFAWLHLMLVVARLVLGRWPHRTGRDDPKFIEIVGEMHAVGILAMLALPLL